MCVLNYLHLSLLSALQKLGWLQKEIMYCYSEVHGSSIGSYNFKNIVMT